ncbi:FliM/FliN family flagellar motor switch protein, partial [Escherichia coli]|uniref:FliM/FliN family flagellar motor switch protein n=1 Tax=Escherichia coli TaxID=562 RepID=UPI00307A5F8D
HSKPQQAAKPVNKPALIKEIIRSLPLTLNVKIAELSMNVADLAQIKAGDILPISLGDTFPVAIGQSELFSALIVEDKDKLFLSELAGKNENSHE